MRGRHVLFGPQTFQDELNGAVYRVPIANMYKFNLQVCGARALRPLAFSSVFRSS